MYSGSAALMLFQSWGKRRSVAGKAAGHRPDAAAPSRLETPVGRWLEPKDRGCMD